MTPPFACMHHTHHTRIPRPHSHTPTQTKGPPGPSPHPPTHPKHTHRGCHNPSRLDGLGLSLPPWLMCAARLCLVCRKERQRHATGLLLRLRCWRQCWRRPTRLLLHFQCAWRRPAQLQLLRRSLAEPTQCGEPAVAAHRGRPKRDGYCGRGRRGGRGGRGESGGRGGGEYQWWWGGQRRWGRSRRSA